MSLCLWLCLCLSISLSLSLSLSLYIYIYICIFMYIFGFVQGTWYLYTLVVSWSQPMGNQCCVVAWPTLVIFIMITRHPSAITISKLWKTGLLLTNLGNYLTLPRSHSGGGGRKSRSVALLLLGLRMWAVSSLFIGEFKT